MAKRIKTGDLVQVIAGAARGRQGRVVAVDPKTGRVRVERVAMRKRHLRAGRRDARTGGIVEQEGYIDASNVMLVDPDAGAPSRVRSEVRDGRKTRVFAKSGQPVPEPGQG